MSRSSLSLSPQCPPQSFSGHWRAVRARRLMCRSFLLQPDELRRHQEEEDWMLPHRNTYILYTACADAYSCVHTHTHTDDTITHVLHCCVQDLTMWESDLLVRVCSGPKAKLSHRKSSASSIVTSCLCGKPRGEPGERDSISVAPDLILCAGAAATITPSAALRRTSFPSSLKMNENMHY